MNAMYAPPDMPKPPETIKPLEIYLVRDLEKEPRNGHHGQTFGRIYLDSPTSDQHLCETWEGQDRRLEDGNEHRQSDGTAIPTGRWRITLHNSRQNGQVPMLHHVPGFRGVEILKERSHEIMPGAIVIGEHRHISGVSMSVLPFNRLVAFLRKQDMQNRPVYLNVARAA